MTGNKNSGRKRKPIAIRKKDGTFENFAHAQCLDLKSGPPRKPPGLGKAGSKCWDLITTELPKKTLAKIDVLELTHLCELADGNAALVAQLKKDPLDLRTRRLQLAVLDRMQKFGAAFGLNPAARAALKNPLEPTESDDLLMKYIAKRPTN